MRGVDVDLHAARLAFFRAEIPNRESCEPTISSVSHSVIMSQLGLRAEQADRAGARKADRRATTALPSSALATPAPRSSATSITSSVALQRARADEHRDLFPCVQNIRRAAQIGVGRDDARRAIADARNARCRACAAAFSTASVPAHRSAR